MFEKINNSGCDRSIFSCIFWFKWRCLCGSHVWKKCIWMFIFISLLLYSKSTVALLNVHSTPWLEMLGVICGLHLWQVVSKVLGDHVMKKSAFWYDSTNVLYWIKNPSRKFKSFAVNWIGEIHTATEPNQWNFVNERINLADTGSQGMDIAGLSCLATKLIGHNKSLNWLRRATWSSRILLKHVWFQTVPHQE